jgi:hypothetical protein
VYEDAASKLLPDEVMRIAKNLLQAKLDPYSLFVFGVVIGQVVRDRTTSSHDEVSPGNGATPPPAPKPKP